MILTCRAISEGQHEGAVILPYILKSISYINIYSQTCVSGHLY